jgi:hypothetical protein
MDLWTIAKLDDAVGSPPCRILDLNAEYRARRSEYVASLSMKNAKGPLVSAAPISPQIHGFFFPRGMKPNANALIFFSVRYRTLAW